METETIEPAESAAPAGPSPLRRMASADRVARPPLSEPDWFGARFARLLENRLRVASDPQATCRFARVRIVKFADLLAKPDETTLAIAVTPQGGFGGLSAIDSELASRVIEAALGAPTVENASADRPITGVDQALMTPLMEDLFGCFSAAAAEAQGVALDEGITFRRFARGASSVLDMESDADMIELQVSLVLRGGAPPKTISVAAPVAALEQIRGAARIEPDEAETFEAPPDPVWDRAMRRAANRAEIKLAVVLRRMRLSIGEASELRPGDVLPLSLDDGLGVELALTGPTGPTEERCVCTGQLGVAGEWRAVKIIEPPDDSLIAAAAPFLEAPG